jgi:RND superfamily putative drug exporter
MMEIIYGGIKTLRFPTEEGLMNPQKVPFWLRWLVPVVLVITWLGIAGIGGPTFGRLDEVSSNDQASFLPAGAEATEAGDWQAKFRDSEEIPAIVIVESDAPYSPPLSWEKQPS